MVKNMKTGEQEKNNSFGASLDRFIPLRMPLTPLQAVELAQQPAEVLTSVHAHGALNRDVKPSNVVLNIDDHGLQDVTLIDFGLARSAFPASTLDEQSVGAALYVAPEEAGTIEGGSDERSELYSLGIGLYEALTGKPPFTNTRASDILRRHLTDDLHELPQLDSVPATPTPFLRLEPG